MRFFKNRINELRNDKTLGIILLLHLVLAVCHICHSFMSDIQYHGELRTVGCGIIAILIFLLGRKGLAFGLLVYACSLIYVNNFYNYGTIFFMLIAFGAYPKIKWQSIVIYAINVIIAFSLKKLLAFSVAIHFIYLLLFWLCIKYVYKVKTPEKLSLTDDERKILDEMVAGKLQKEIDLFSPQTITAKIKSARERNLCENTAELISKYALELQAN